MQSDDVQYLLLELCPIYKTAILLLCDIYKCFLYTKIVVVLMLNSNEYHISLHWMIRLFYICMYVCMFACVGRWFDEYFLDEMTKNYSFRKKNFWR